MLQWLQCVCRCLLFIIFFSNSIAHSEVDVANSVVSPRPGGAPKLLAVLRHIVARYRVVFHLPGLRPSLSYRLDGVLSNSMIRIQADLIEEVRVRVGLQDLSMVCDELVLESTELRHIPCPSQICHVR